MENYIIIIILAVAIGVGLRSTVKHFGGQGGCCGGGGDYKLKKEKLSKVLYQKTFRVEGMHCSHCKVRVENAVNDIRGVAGRVDLKRELLTVSYAEDVPDRLICARVGKAGYTITTVP